MADGSWTIKQWNPNSDRFKVEKIRVWHDPETDSVVPGARVEGTCLILYWPDRNDHYYPWCSIVKAEYVPPTRDDSWPGQGDTL